MVADSRLPNFRSMNEAIKIVEVGPRDGLQNEKQPIDVDTKVGLIERLVAAGRQPTDYTRENA